MAETAEQRSNRRIDEVLDDLVNEHKPRWKLTKREAAALIGGFYLKRGDGELDPDHGANLRTQALCVMQTANVYHSVLTKISPGIAPSYQEVDEVDPIIEAYMVVLNDALDDPDRQRLMAYIPRLLNTRVTEKTERRTKILKALYGEYTWKWFSAQGLSYDGWVGNVVEHCVGLGSLPLNDTTDEAIKNIKKSQWLEAVNAVLDPSEWYDRSDFMESLIAREGVEAAFKIAERLLRAR